MNTIHMKDFNPNSDTVQLKKYDPAQIENLVSLDLKSLQSSPDQVARFEKVSQLAFQAETEFDLICNTRSPGYTPKSADERYKLINNYIEPYS